jgi:tol-pal system protein YbgF
MAINRSISLQDAATANRSAQGSPAIGAESEGSAPNTIRAPRGLSNLEEDVSPRRLFSLSLHLVGAFAVGVAVCAGAMYFFLGVNLRPQLSTASLPLPVAVVPGATPQPPPVVAAPVVPTTPVSAVAAPDQSELSPSEVVEVQTLPLPSATEAKLPLPPSNATAPLPSPVAVVPAATPQPSPVVAAPVVPTAPVSAVATPGQSELSPSETVEVQTRLEALGMKPGRLDGILGSRTIGAIKRYEEANGLPQTGNIDREILGRLRQEKPISQAESASRKTAAPSAAAGPDQVYNDAFKKLQDGDYADAERGFKAFLQSNPRHVLAGNAQYWLGETYYARRDYQNAMTAFADGYEVYKASPKGPDNLLKLGVTLAALGRKPDACKAFAKFNRDYPRAIDLQKRRVEQERQKNGCG